MGWYPVEAKGDEKEVLRAVVNEFYYVKKLIHSFRHVYTHHQKSELESDHDAVSYHAAQMEDNRVIALVILERHSKDGIVYKPYAEEECPSAFLCPRSILHKLSPTDNLIAKEWRRRAYRFNVIQEAERKRGQATWLTQLVPALGSGISM